MGINAKIEIPVLEVTQGDFTFYVSSVQVGKVLKICKPLEELKPDQKDFTPAQVDNLQKALEQPSFSKEIDSIISDVPIDPYQRVLNEARAKKIARYLNEPDSIFPNSIILAVDPEIAPELNKKEGQLILSIPVSQDTAVILDGQHRLAAFRYADENFNKTRFEDFTLVVTFLFDIPFYLQAEIFAIINGTQTKVNRSIVYSLLGYRNQASNLYSGEMAAYRFSHYMTRILNSSKVSPWCGLIKMRGTGRGLVTQAAIIDHLKDLLTPKVYSQRLNYYPVLYEYYKEQRINELAKYLIIYFGGIRAAWPNHWALKTSLFSKTNGVAVMFRILHDLVIVKDDLTNFKVDDIASYWRLVPENKITVPPAGGSKGYQDQLYVEFAKEMKIDIIVREKKGTMKNRLSEIGGLI